MDKEIKISEELAKNLTIESKSVDDVDLKSLEEFIGRESQPVTRRNRRKDVPIDEDLQFVHVFVFSSSSHDTLKVALEPEARPHSFITWAKDGEKNIGVNIVAIEMRNGKPTVVASFVGVAWEYQGKRIGRKLLRERHQQLKQRGIKQYQTRVRDASRLLFDKEQADGLLDFAIDENDPDSLTVTLK